MDTIQGKDVRKVIIACDAGMGSSVMVASDLARRFKPYSVEVAHLPVHELPAEAELVLCHESLLVRARKSCPEAVILGFSNFLGDPVFDRVEQAIRDGEPLG